MSPVRVDRVTVAAAAVIAYAAALGPHRSDRALVSASLNALVALSAWLVFRTRVGRPRTVALVAWLTFAVSAWLATAYLATSPLGFGDWMVLLRDLPNAGLLRASAVVTGLFVAGQLWKGTVRTLAQLVGNGAASERARTAAGTLTIAWIVGGAVALAATLGPAGGLGPRADVGLVVLTTLGTLGATSPLLLAARRVGEEPVPGEPIRVARSWPTIALGVLAGALLMLGLGPGFGP